VSSFFRTFVAADRRCDKSAAVGNCLQPEQIDEGSEPLIFVLFQLWSIFTAKKEQKTRLLYA
jgi:hypothetical protein